MDPLAKMYEEAQVKSLDGKKHKWNSERVYARVCARVSQTLSRLLDEKKIGLSRPHWGKVSYRSEEWESEPSTIHVLVKFAKPQPGNSQEYECFIPVGGLRGFSNRMACKVSGEDFFVEKMAASCLSIIAQIEIDHRETYDMEPMPAIAAQWESEQIASATKKGVQESPRTKSL